MIRHFFTFFRFSEYKNRLVEHLLTVAMIHWDVEIRVLASAALGGLLETDASYDISSITRRLVTS